MTRRSTCAAIATGVLACLLRATALAADYLPPAGTEWAVQAPEKAGFDAAKLQAAIDFAIAQESPAPRDLGLAMALNFAREPYDAQIGPTQPRGTGAVAPSARSSSSASRPAPWPRWRAASRG